MLNRPALPKPVKVCVRCDATFDGNGRRCHDCVVELGQQGARLLAGGADLEEVAEELGLPERRRGSSKLAVKYGDARVVIGAEEINRQLQQAADGYARVMTTLRDDYSACDGRRRDRV